MSTRISSEVPLRDDHSGLWGSDVIADMLRALDVQYVALNPGSSFRGLHDSLVNHLHNQSPQMLLCLHEEHAVAIAHGWAKVTRKPMAVVLHANVGLMHAAMAIYNAWCDRVPILILGATGPVDAALRRPWIDSLHTAKDQAAMVRPYVKWDDQPASLEASIAALLEGKLICETTPQGPTYVCLDVRVQEESLKEVPALPEVSRYATPAVPVPNDQDLQTLASLLDDAQRPVVLLGRVSHDEADWQARVAVAEHWQAQVLTDIKTGSTFPTNHSLHVGPASFFLSTPQEEAVRQADLIVCLDWVDAGASVSKLNTVAKVVNVTMDHQLKNGWSYDQGQPLFADLRIASTPDACLRALAQRVGLPMSALPSGRTSFSRVGLNPAQQTIDMSQLAAGLHQGLADERVTLVRLPLGWDASHWHFTHPLDYLGYDGGAGIGSGPGMLVGAALALRDRGRLPVAILGDGDTMMGISALWTAAHYRIPMLLIVCNNRSYFNDEVHQEKVAVQRGRPVANKAIGQAMTDPDINFAQLAEAQGLTSFGPITRSQDLVAAISRGICAAKEGASVVIDVRIVASYAQAMSSGMTESTHQSE